MSTLHSNNETATFIVTHFTNHLIQLNISVMNNRKIDGKCLGARFATDIFWNK